MKNPTIEYADKWGECSARPDDRCCEIRWFDTTAEMDGEDFNQFLSNFATTVEKSDLPGALVDAVQFKMDMSKMSMGWRDEHIVPRYNAAGLKKFAFVMPIGMPLIDAPPVIEGPANYPTANFGSRKEALAWLAE